MTGTLATLIVCSWIAKDGTASFTDNPRRIPPAYQEVAVCAPAGKLEDYERYTHRESIPFTEPGTNSGLSETDSRTENKESLSPAQQDKPTPERRRKRHRSERNPR